MVNAESFRIFVNRCLATGILFIAGSCLPDPLLVESVPRARAELVVSTQILPDQSLLVFLSRTFGALTASEDSDPQAVLELIAVNDALVTIDGPTGKDTLTLLGYGVYGGILSPFEAGETYDLYIKSESLGEAYATTEVKPMIAFDKLEAQLFYSEYNDTLAQITYNLVDPPGENWYMINVQEIERQDVAENMLNPRAFTMLLSDEKFDGGLYGERFQVYPRDYQPGDTIAVSLANISEEYYGFMKLRTDNRFSLVEFVSEPVDYPSNVVGGRGYFNLHVPDVRFFVLN